MAKKLFSIHFTSKNVLFRLGQNFLSGTKMFCLGQKLFCLVQKIFCPGQKISCPGRWTGHKCHTKKFSASNYFFPTASLITFMIGYSIGFATVPFILMGELLPARYRNLLGGIASRFVFSNVTVVCN